MERYVTAAKIVRVYAAKIYVGIIEREGDDMTNSEIEKSDRCYRGSESCSNKIEPPHVCPFLVEIDGDDKTLCNCCEDCQGECCDDI